MRRIPLDSLQAVASKIWKANLPANSAMIQATRYVWLTINMNAPQLKDPRVRQAIQYAYDGDADPGRL